MAQKAVVNEDTCIGCNTCPILDPDTFEMNMESYKAVVKNSAPAPNSKTRDAADSCPVGAISIVD